MGTSLPVFVGATVRSMNHVNSLKIESESRVPGEIPTFQGVREQRLTGVVTFILIGLSVFLTPVLKHIPMPVLYGVFLYMGISALDGIQLVDRILLMFMPMKYQPDYVYLRHVSVGRVHFFTIVQILCLAGLWVVKSIEVIAIAFPLMLIVMVVMRSLLSFVFAKEELEHLDDELPEMFVRRTEDLLLKEKAHQEGTALEEGGMRPVRSASTMMPRASSWLSPNTTTNQEPQPINELLNTPSPQSKFAGMQAKMPWLSQDKDTTAQDNQPAEKAPLLKPDDTDAA